MSQTDQRYLMAISRIENIERDIAAAKDAVESLSAQIASLHSNLDVVRRSEAQNLDEVLKSMLEESKRKAFEALSMEEKYIQKSHATCIEALAESAEKKMKMDCEKRKADYDVLIASELNHRSMQLKARFEEEISKHLAKDEAHHEERLKAIMRQHKRRIDSLEVS